MTMTAIYRIQLFWLSLLILFRLTVYYTLERKLTATLTKISPEKKARHQSEDADHTKTHNSIIHDEIARIKPTVVIMDIEGSEAELLPFMDFAGIRMLMVEMHPRSIGLKTNALRKHFRNNKMVEVDRQNSCYFYRRTE